MSVADRLNTAESHLRRVWETLVREREPALARTVEGVLAELTDEAIGPECRLMRAAIEWRKLNAFPRGLPDWGLWRDDEKERLQLTSDYEKHRQAVDDALG